MVVAWSILATGKVTIAEADLYIGSTGGSWVKKAIFHNTHNVNTITLDVLLRIGAGTSVMIGRYQLAPSESCEIENIALAFNDRIRASATDNTSIDFAITGGVSS